MIYMLTAGPILQYSPSLSYKGRVHLGKKRSTTLKEKNNNQFQYHQNRVEKHL